MIGFADGVRGEEICAVVVRAPEGGSAPIWDADTLIAWSKERLGGHKYPGESEFVPALSLGPSGCCEWSQDRSFGRCSGSRR